MHIFSIITLILSTSFILLQTTCHAWLIPMQKNSVSDKAPNALDDVVGSNADDELPADPKEVIGIKIVKYTRQDPAMQFFDFDMDSARKFAFKEWQKLLDVYSPVLSADIEFVEMPSKKEEEKRKSPAPQKSEKVDSTAEEAPQLEAQPLVVEKLENGFK